VADDHTPVEFSIAFNEHDHPTLRILGEALAPRPSATTNLSAAHGFLGTQANRFGLSMSQFESVRDLFATEHPQGDFALWHSMVFGKRKRPRFKVYFNPELKGVEQAPDLVTEALRRLGLGRSYQIVLDHSIRPGELGRGDRLAFFALDLHDGPHARVKLYLSHCGAEVRDVIRAASVVDGIDAAEFASFCKAAAGGMETFADRPLVGSYTFLGEADRPAGYSIYVPIRSYVGDDEEARGRVAALLDRYGFDSTKFDRAITAVARRPLREGVGLIAHVALRLGLPRPGVTVYLSAEAYRVNPPRHRRMPTACDYAYRPADCPAV
jgi:DMATS type aromatic prenyltransferase